MRRSHRTIHVFSILLATLALMAIFTIAWMISGGSV
jgi:hypothetical protein